MQIFLIPALSDNYIYLLHQPELDFSLVIDPAEAEPVENFLTSKDWSLDLILNTHHHWDHVGGNERLKQTYQCPAWGPRPVPGSPPISSLDRHLREGQLLPIGQELCQVLEVPGHTLDHIAFYFPQAEALFVGDTLFSVGCGRLFEGSAEQMWSSLDKIRLLPRSTKIYCAHEYTLQNIEFALSVEPQNSALRRWQSQAQSLRQSNQPSLPTSLQLELECNPFLRPESEAIRESLGLSAKTSDLEVFRRLRQLKDQF